MSENNKVEHPETTSDVATAVMCSTPAVSPLPDEMIPVDSETGRRFGFTSDRFSPISYLWGKNDDVIVSFIHSTEQGKGYFSGLVKNIEAQGYRVVVSTPLPRMEAILVRWGWKPSYVWDDDFQDNVQIWTKG